MEKRGMILIIKEANFTKEKELLEKMGVQVKWTKNFRDGKKSLKQGQFDLIIIGIIFLNKKDKKINGPYFGKRGGLKFIKENIQLLHEHIKNDKVVIYSWNKNWQEGELLPSKVAKTLNIKLINKHDGLISFENKIKSLLNIKQKF